jgi:hypothetical protein
MPTETDAVKREMLRHFLAALVHRTQKALRSAPDSRWMGTALHTAWRLSAWLTRLGRR